MNLWRLMLSAIAAVLLSIAYLPLLNKTNSTTTTFFSNFLNLSPRKNVLQLADFIVTNGTIFTADDALQFVEAMAIRDSRIVAVGNYSFIKDIFGSETKVFNLKGKIVVPGFIDSHVHLISGGLQMATLDLHGVNSKDHFVNMVGEAVRYMKHGSWLLGGGWNNDLWGGMFPMASWIDDITPNNPVWLSRMDGHMGFANSLALKIAGVSNHTRDPVGGAIMKDSDGEPTGLLIDSAMKLVLSSIPEVSVDERRDALLRASNLALTRGVTTVVDFGRYFPGSSAELPWEDFSGVYKWADSLGKMLIRVCLYFPWETWARLHDFIKEGGRMQSPWLYLGGVKAFADGSLGSSSALLHEPYVDEPDNYGLQVADLESLENMTLLADKSGLQVAIHAIGDKAIDIILDMYTLVASKNGIRDRRSRIEHAQHLVPSTAATRFGEQNIIASVQPDHLLDDAGSAIKKLGLQRAEKSSYLFRSLLSSGAKLAFGSDWPVADIYPLRSMQTATKRTPPGWEVPWMSSECINLIDALKAYTIFAAEACFLDQYVGSLSPGKLADFVVLSAHSWDDFAAGGSAAVEATYVGGIRAFP